MGEEGSESRGAKGFLFLATLWTAITSFRMAATRATFGGLPLAVSLSYNTRSHGLRGTAPRVVM